MCGMQVEGVVVLVDECSVQTFSNLFLKILTEGAVTTKARSLFQYFTTLTEKVYPLLRLIVMVVGSV